MILSNLDDKKFFEVINHKADRKALFLCLKHYNLYDIESEDDLDEYAKQAKVRAEIIKKINDWLKTI
jgi:hypothetical protein